MAQGTEQEARARDTGLNSPDLAFLGDGWPTPERPAVAAGGTSFPPGGTATFSFRGKGALPGIFVVPLRAWWTGAQWMDDLGMYTVVTVR